MCEVCKRRDMGENEKYFIKGYETGYLTLFDNQAYEGYCLYVFKRHIEDIFEMTETERFSYFKELSEIIEKLNNLYKPLKMNYCFLGNGCRHLHCHIIPNNEGSRTIWHRDYRENFDYNISEIVEKIRGVL